MGCETCKDAPLFEGQHCNTCSRGPGEQPKIYNNSRELLIDVQRRLSFMQGITGYGIGEDRVYVFAVDSSVGDDIRRATAGEPVEVIVTPHLDKENA